MFYQSGGFDKNFAFGDRLFTTFSPDFVVRTMGTFAGHLLPGLVFVVLSSWWSLQAGWRYWRARLAGKQFSSSATYHGSTRVPLETIFKASMLM